MIQSKSLESTLESMQQMPTQRNQTLADRALRGPPMSDAEGLLIHQIQYMYMATPYM